MDEDRKHELSVAINMLLLHNLWRSAKIAQMPCLSKELGDAIETVCGAAYEHLADSIELDINRKALKSCEYNLGQQECITKSTKDMLDDARKEIRRLKSILARHKIKYREGDAK